MPTPVMNETIHAFEMVKDIEIAAPVEVVFETLLEHLGPAHEVAPETPLPMKLEAWPGGRWYRDLGNATGHFWGHVQVIKPPRILEISGPLFMSFPAISHLEYRLTAEGGRTRLKLRHRAFGQIPADELEAFTTPAEGREPWSHTLKKIQDVAEHRRTSAGQAR
jgi:uncharacterized protein YndB with AHSA1/START domain